MQAASQVIRQVLKSTTQQHCGPTLYPNLTHDAPIHPLIGSGAAGFVCSSIRFTVVRSRGCEQVAAPQVSMSLVLHLLLLANQGGHTRFSSNYTTWIFRYLHAGRLHSDSIVHHLSADCHQPTTRQQHRQMLRRKNSSRYASCCWTALRS